ncbi:hypothetical protein JD969_13805 [Planctomycetota bacterium]|nr:hypothetical protein JD969_13805 [Planctomycetota bacterium]
MSVMGTGVAAGVAQTALQGQQQARQKDKKVREDQQSTEKVLKVFEAHIKGLEENDSDEESSARLHVDSQVRDHEDLIDDAPSKLTKKVREETMSAASDVADLSAEAQRLAMGQNQDPQAAALLNNLGQQSGGYTTPVANSPAQKVVAQEEIQEEKGEGNDESGGLPPYKHLDIQA